MLCLLMLKTFSRLTKTCTFASKRTFCFSLTCFLRNKSEIERRLIPACVFIHWGRGLRMTDRENARRLPNPSLRITVGPFCVCLQAFLPGLGEVNWNSLPGVAEGFWQQRAAGSLPWKPESGKVLPSISLPPLGTVAHAPVVATQDHVSNLLLPETRRRNEKRYQCTLCILSYTSSSSLSRHMQVHTGKFSFHCEHCRKGFNERSNYQQHMIKHEGKPSHLTCAACGKGFASRNKLRQHMAERHAQQLSWMCVVCQEVFVEESVYKEHLQTHSKGEETRCPDAQVFPPC